MTIRQRIKEYWPLMLAGLFIISATIYAIYVTLFPVLDISFSGVVVYVDNERVVFDNVDPDPAMSNKAQASFYRHESDGQYVFNLGKFNSRFNEGQTYLVLLRDGKVRMLFPWHNNTP